MYWQEHRAGQSIARAVRRRPEIVLMNGKVDRDPAVHEEIQRRVSIYATQVQEGHRISWLPYAGSGA